jgi:hypothetical protein
MPSTPDLKAPSLPHAWADLQADARGTDWSQPEAHRLAFADPEFLLRRETRGIRFQLEMLKPDLAQIEAGIEHTVVVFGSARFVDRPTAQAQLQIATASGQASAIAKAQALLRNAEHYENARIFAQRVAQSCACLPAVLASLRFVCTHIHTYTRMTHTYKQKTHTDHVHLVQARLQCLHPLCCVCAA